MKKILFILLIISSVFITSCSKKEEDKIVLDSSHPLSLAPDIRWALVIEPYSAFKKDMNYNAENIAYCRKGDILRVLGHSTDKNHNSWYKFEKGWLPETAIVIYSNRYKAENAGKQLKD